MRYSYELQRLWEKWLQPQLGFNLLALANHVFSFLKVFVLSSLFPHDKGDHPASILCSLRESMSRQTWLMHSNAVRRCGGWTQHEACHEKEGRAKEISCRRALTGNVMQSNLGWCQINSQCKRRGEEERKKKEEGKKERQPCGLLISPASCVVACAQTLKVLHSTYLSQFGASFSLSFVCLLFVLFFYGAGMLNTLDRIAFYVSSHTLRHIAWWVSREAFVGCSGWAGGA